METDERIDYYHLRLEAVIDLYFGGEKELVKANQGIVERLVQGYDKFKVQEGYDPILSLTIKNFVLDKNN